MALKFAKYGETTPILFDAAVTKPSEYGVFSGSAPVAPVVGDFDVILQDFASSYQIVTGGNFPVPLVGSVHPGGVALEVRAHRSAGNEAWTDLAIASDGKTINTTLAVTANTGWAIEIRVKATQVTIYTSTSFTVVAA